MPHIETPSGWRPTTSTVQGIPLIFLDGGDVTLIEGSEHYRLQQRPNTVVLWGSFRLPMNAPCSSMVASRQLPFGERSGFPPCATLASPRPSRFALQASRTCRFAAASAIRCMLWSTIARLLPSPCSTGAIFSSEIGTELGDVMPPAGTNAQKNRRQIDRTEERRRRHSTNAAHFNRRRR